MPSKVCLYEAAFYGDERQLSLALQAGQDPSKKDDTGQTPFHMAAANGHINCLRMLIDNGCAVDVIDINGCTALHTAARNGHIDTVKWLVDNGGNTKVESNKGNTPLIVAKANARTTVVSFLKNCDRKKMSWED